MTGRWQGGAQGIVAWLLTSLALLSMAPALGQDLAECSQLADDAARLACYDRLLREADLSTDAATPAEPEAEPSAPEEAAEPATTTPAEHNALSTFWELTPAHKRGTFVVRTYLPNYVLPLHYTSDINRYPSSPTHPAPAEENNYRDYATKLQISLRTKVAEGLLLPGADLWFAYTQRSQWQVWNPQDSRPFRNTDYQPEAIYVIPVPERWAALSGSWRWRLLQVGLTHQSNGQSEPLSRSWNRVFAATAFERGDFNLMFQLDQRSVEAGPDDNPDLLHYIGDAQIVAAWLPGRATASLTWRTDVRSGERGSLQLDWTYPIHYDQPSGARWYVQLFSGYGESLLDYNHRQKSIGVGLSLFQF